MLKAFLVAAVRTVAWVSAGQSCIKTFAIFFLTLWFFTVTCPICVPICRSSFLFQLLFGNLYLLIVPFLVVTPVTGALGCASLPGWKTLTVHLKTVCLFTCTPSFRVFFLLITKVQLSLGLLINQKAKGVLFVDGWAWFKLFLKTGKR